MANDSPTLEEALDGARFRAKQWEELAKHRASPARTFLHETVILREHDRLRSELTRLQGENAKLVAEKEEWRHKCAEMFALIESLQNNCEECTP